VKSPVSVAFSMTLKDVKNRQTLNLVAMSLEKHIFIRSRKMEKTNKCGEKR